MMIHQKCDNCQNPLDIPEKYAGQKGLCAKCGATVLVQELHVAIEPIITEFLKKPWQVFDTHQHVVKDSKWARKVLDLGPRAIPYLVSALKTDNWAYAMEFLVKIQDPQAIEPLVAILQDTNSTHREMAAQLLGYSLHPKAIEALMAALCDKDIHLRIQVAFAIGRTQNPSSVPALHAALNSPCGDSWNKRSFIGAIGYALGNIGTNEACLVLISKIQSFEKSGVRILEDIVMKKGMYLEPSTIEAISKIQDFVVIESECNSYNDFFCEEKSIRVDCSKLREIAAKQLNFLH